MKGFSEFALSPELQVGLKKRGFKTPTPIQELVLPEVGKGKDLIVQAQTGSGKTLAYGLPLLDRVPVDERAPTVLVVTPTRELARQIRVELESVSAGLDRKIAVAVGGESLDKLVGQLRRGVHLLVGTPGRLVELVSREVLNLKHVRHLVLDEADEILAKGFARELNVLIERMPPTRQTLLFSATFPAAVQRLADEALRKPRRLKVAEAPATPTEIVHQLMEVTDETRLEALHAWLEAERPFMTLVFARTRVETEWVQAQLATRGIGAEYLSGELSQAKRTRILASFRQGDLPVLVATDLAARGLDIPGITHVVNFAVPTQVESYIHRTGRTGRAGRPGVALTLMAPHEQHLIDGLRALVSFHRVATPKGLGRTPLRSPRPPRARTPRKRV